MDPREAAVRWANTWVAAWKSHDVDSVVALYAQECVHRSAPFRKPHRGRQGVREYVVGAFADESAVLDVHFGEPIVDGHRASVEYRARSLDRDGAPVTLAGCAFAHFDTHGLLTEVRDYWHETTGPPPSDSAGGSR
jgi:ketosteroid isomerase-like protein